MLYYSEDPCVSKIAKFIFVFLNGNILLNILHCLILEFDFLYRVLSKIRVKANKLVYMPPSLLVLKFCFRIFPIQQFAVCLNLDIGHSEFPRKWYFALPSSFEVCFHMVTILQGNLYSLIHKISCASISLFSAFCISPHWFFGVSGDMKYILSLFREEKHLKIE